MQRFGFGSPERETEIDELVGFLGWAKRAGVERVIVNGSFVTATTAPNDVDIIVLPGLNYPRGESRAHDEGWLFPFLQVVVAIDVQEFENWSAEVFESDREGNPKGVVEVIVDQP